MTADAWTAARPRLVRVAYAILGSVAEAEDVVSECWFRLARAGPVHDVEAWAVVTVTRAATDVLRSARMRRETYPGPWLPEPVVTADPADRITLDERIGYALLVVLESLTPAERTAWVLHDLFGLPFEEVATVVGRTPAAVRQLAVRARRHVRDRTPRLDIDPDQHRRVVQRFLAAAAGGRLGDLVAMLDPDAVVTSDGGGRTGNARRPVHGAPRAAHFLLALAAKAEPLTPVTVNGLLGMAVHRDGRVDTIIAFTVAAGRIQRVDLIRAPDKLARIQRTEPG
ncbi:RNA polymerase sigma-70 factor (ECF subfamily) [Actinoplanes campanulatus]|uniref:RNA polymerase sigma-70 factor (ECF subfamily) n=1 Tax=Actinoplanes campanulatus TaxID=113559 RepID=A0A7W5AE55_9ACTN|nr:RNA polymerase sigma factor SigJ [Actinoplanes campanulatus]MBB3094395.1 RNA polymerase sigma-70 factor (ECF subfamily) [Actinoplanes campanulatus]GGN20751.1 RNA polymerase sigma24 factor [Actinoplanes campanulatus]GID35690.1 RNA polymerase sigma24 factor [Actinoplanes campanulatus]